jgi:hypothetical protein
MTFPHLVIARVYEHIEPIDRGGGSQLDELGGIAYAEVEIELANLDDALSIVAGALDAAGAPQGSELRQDDRVLREFGTQQCLA